MDPWIVETARSLRGKRRRDPRSSLDSLVMGDAIAEHAAEGLDPSLAFTLRLARALLGLGLPAHRVEETLYRLADALGFDIDAFCTPTAMVVTMSTEDATSPSDVRTRVVRAEPGETDLERLSALHDLVGRVERKEISPGDGTRRLEAILARPPRYGPTLTAFAFGLLSSASAVLLGGGGLDLPVAGSLGLLVGTLTMLGSRIPTIKRLLPAVAACAVSFLASTLAWQGLPVRPSVLLLAAIIVLLPGFTVTTATVELASAHLVSGTARLMGAFVTFLQIGFGVALGRKAVELLPRIPAPPQPESLPRWTVVAAALVSALGFTILLRAKPRDGGLMVVGVGLGLLGSQLGGELMGAELGAFVGALTVGIASNVFARYADRPVSVMLVPGTLFLVPGSVGFLSIRSLLENDPQGAIVTGFRMALVAMALAAGILVATAAVPPRRAF